MAEISQLLSISSHLAAAEGYLERNTAYEIATRVAALRGTEFPGLARGAELVLSRLGNFPGRDLLRKRFKELPVKEPLLQLEMRIHEIENTITDAGGRRRRLTDFQFDALSSFAAHRSVSLSAPTSAGKSFLLGLEVLRKLRYHRPAGIAYLVPTRALIRQVVVDLREIAVGSELPFPLIPQCAAVIFKRSGILTVDVQNNYARGRILGGIRNGCQQSGDGR